MDYVFGSTVAFGNDGTTTTIPSMPCRILRSLKKSPMHLHLASDHLPLEVLFTMTWTEEEDTTIVDTTANSIPDLHSCSGVSKSRKFFIRGSGVCTSSCYFMDMQGSYDPANHH